MPIAHANAADIIKTNNAGISPCPYKCMFINCLLNIKNYLHC